MRRTQRSIAPQYVEPIPKLARELFKSTRNYQETLILSATDPPIPLGNDLASYPINGSMYWVNARLHIFISIGPQGCTIEQAREQNSMKFGEIILDEYASIDNVWLLARALSLVLVGALAELVQVQRDPVNGVSYYPIECWTQPNGKGSCPACKVQLPWVPAFPIGAIRRCPACRAIMIHREGKLEVMISSL